MKANPLFKAFILTLTVVIGFMICLEWYWRSRGFKISYNDDKVFWSVQRKSVHKAGDQATVVIGSSRIKFDFDIPCWKALTGENAIQLALVGTSPRILLRDLSRDEKFKGKLIIDVAEFVLFPIDTGRWDKSARECLDYYYHETPAQKTGALINSFLESQLVLLEEGKFGLNALLNDLATPNRPRVFARPVFPKEFTESSFERQSRMTPMFLTDSSLQKRKLDTWTRSFNKKAAGIKGDTLEAVFKEIKMAIDKIRSRGGSVAFVRPPSNGEFLETENHLYPRQQYWDRLLDYTKTSGIHFLDYSALAKLTCPDWSHLAPQDAVTYTTQLVKILEQEVGWTFPNKVGPASRNANSKADGL
ncbi:MAG: hypothetical protein WKF87_19525 [Chryseolinea sp.]